MTHAPELLEVVREFMRQTGRAGEEIPADYLRALEPDPIRMTLEKLALVRDRMGDPAPCPTAMARLAADALERVFRLWPSISHFEAVVARTPAGEDRADTMKLAEGWLLVARGCACLLVLPGLASPEPTDVERVELATAAVALAALGAPLNERVLNVARVPEKLREIARLVDLPEGIRATAEAVAHGLLLSGEDEREIVRSLTESHRESSGATAPPKSVPANDRSDPSDASEGSSRQVVPTLEEPTTPESTLQQVTDSASNPTPAECVVGCSSTGASEASSMQIEQMPSEPTIPESTLQQVTDSASNPTPAERPEGCPSSEAASSMQIERPTTPESMFAPVSESTPESMLARVSESANKPTPAERVVTCTAKTVYVDGVALPARLTDKDRDVLLEILSTPEGFTGTGTLHARLKLAPGTIRAAITSLRRQLIVDGVAILARDPREYRLAPGFRGA